MAALTILGVFTVFGEALAAVFTQAPAPAVTAPATPEPGGSPSLPSALPSVNAPDGGGGKP